MGGNYSGPITSHHQSVHYVDELTAQGARSYYIVRLGYGLTVQWRMAGSSRWGVSELRIVQYCWLTNTVDQRCRLANMVTQVMPVVKRG